MDLGRLVPPYPVKCCQSAECGQQLDKSAFLFTDLDSGKLCVFCGECALYLELMHHERFRLMPL